MDPINNQNEELQKQLLEQNKQLQTTSQQTEERLTQATDVQAFEELSRTEEEQRKSAYEAKEAERWAMVNAFRKKSGEATITNSNYKNEYGSMDIFELRDALLNDSKSKSKLFDAMVIDLDTFLKLSETSGKTEFDTAIITSDYGDSLIAARKSVHNYLSIRSGQIHIFDNGKRRLDIAERIERLLDDMSLEINKKVGGLPEKEKRMAMYRRDKLTDDEIKERENQYELNEKALDARHVIETGEFGPKMDEKTKAKLQENWLAGNFTEKLLKLLDNPTALRTKDEKNDFLAAIMDKNNLLLANKMTVILTVEANKKASMGLPWITADMRRYVGDHLTDEEALTLQPEQIAARTKELMAEYEDHYANELGQMQERVNKLKTLIPVHENEKDSERIIEDICAFPEMESLLYFEDREQFNDRFKKLREKVEADDAEIDAQLAKYYSKATRESIKLRMNSHMAGLRLFGSTDAVLEQTGLFRSRLQYLAPVEFRTERMLDRLMKKNSIPSMLRDSFLEMLTIGMHEELCNHEYSFWEKNAKEIAKTYKSNASYFSYKVSGDSFKSKIMSFFGKEDLNVPQKTWDELEALKLKSLEFTPAEFKEEVKRIIQEGKQSSETKLIREEYLTKRKFIDEDTKKVRIQHAEKEQKKIDDIGDSFDTKFLLAIENKGLTGLEHYKKTDRIFRGTDAFYRAQDAYRQSVQKDLITARTNTLKQLFRNSNVPEDRIEEFTERFSWMINGLAANGTELFNDDRLECERINLENYGVRSWDDAIAKLPAYIPSLINGETHQDIEDAKTKLSEGTARIAEFENGRFKGIADILMDIPDVYRTVMSGDTKALDKLMKEKIAPGFGPACDAQSDFVKNEFHGEPLFKQYIYSNLIGIYAGNVKGDAAYHNTRMKDYSRRIYSARLNDNLRKVEQALNDKYAKTDRHKNDDAKKPFKPTGDEIVLTGEIKFTLMMIADNTERFEEFLDAEKTVQSALELYEARKVSLNQSITYSEEIKAHAQEVTEATYVADPLEAKRREYAERKNEGRRMRTRVLGLDLKDLNEVRQSKSLVRNGLDGKTTVSLDKADTELVRGELLKQVDFQLPPVLRDAIIEEGARRGIRATKNFVKFDPDDPMNGELYRHAQRMSQLYENLRRDTEDDPAMSEEEAQMFAVRLYANRTKDSIFENKSLSAKGVDVAAVRKTQDYKVFRENYRKLKAFEAEEVTDPSLQREHEDMSRNLRIALITGGGVIVKDKKKTVRYSELKTDEERSLYGEAVGLAIDKQLEYLKYSRDLERVIRKQVEDFYSDPKKKISVFHEDALVQALREHFLSDMLTDMENGVIFREEDWVDDIKELVENSKERDAVMNEKNSVTERDLVEEEQRRVETGIGEETISSIIKNSAIIFHGRENMYEKLDLDQKKFFAIALMLMDKGAVGYGSSGTGALLVDNDKKKALGEQIGLELQKYIRGEEYHINVDYREAAYKLIEYQNVSDLSLKTRYDLSAEAYEKALVFARNIYSKKQSYNKGELDMDRIKDGYASIEAAFLESGKQQKNEIDRLQVEPLTKEDVISKLIKYAENEKLTAKDYAMGALGAGMMLVGGAAILGSNVTQSQQMKEHKKEAEKNGKDKNKAELNVKEYGIDNAVSTAGLATAGEGLVLVDGKATKLYDFSKLMNRLKSLEQDEEQLKLFLRIMQDRTVLDKSTADPSRCVDQEKRDILFNALTGDNKVLNDTMKGFDDDESCHQAYINAMSFQLRDDAYFKGKMIGKEHFANNALNRGSVVDWELIIRAFDFMDEIRERRAEVYATSHATDYIRQTGNTEAIAELDKLEKEYSDKKESFDLNAIEDRLKELKKTSRGYLSGGQEEIERAWSGYMALSDQDKNLFYKVLQRRDLLDISKKNYVQNFFGISDRNFLNATGRNELLNEYIQASLYDGVGVTLDKDAYYKAMQSLLSTQVSDIVSFKDKTDISGKVTGIFSYERLGFFGRGCAIDWKLFKRALSFVNRARNELKTQEGNALLYQGAGDIEAQGHIDMDYSFLRRNIHKTGNQWSRLIGKIAVRRAKQELGLDGILDQVASLAGTVNDVAKLLGASEDGLLRKGAKFVNEKGKQLQTYSKSLGNSQFTAINVQSENEYKQELKDSKKTKEELEAEKKAAEKAAEEAEKKRREELMFIDRIKEGFDNIVKEKTSIENAVSSMETYLNQELKIYTGKQLQSKSAEADKNNLVEKTVGNGKIKEKGDISDKYTEIKGKVDDVKEYWNIAGQVPFLQNLRELMVYGIEKAVYGSLINGVIIKNDVTHDANGNALDMTRKDEINALKLNAMQFVKENVNKMTESIFGKEAVDKLKTAEEFVYQGADFINVGMTYFTKGFDYAKKCTAFVKNISQSAENIKSINKGAQDSKEHREEDKKKLKKAGEKRLNERQLEKAKGAHEMHQAYGGMSETITTAIQGFNIASDVINFTIDSINTWGGKLSYPASLLSKAIQDGLEIAMFAMRVCTDRKALQDYFFTTDDGLKSVHEIREGCRKADTESARQNGKKIDNMLLDYGLSTQISNVNMIDIIADSKGYEHTSELVEDVGMNMAQSLVFCASKFNPMMETKIMAMTVMSVMGLSPAEIGQTSPEITRKLFESFKMSR